MYEVPLQATLVVRIHYQLILGSLHQEQATFAHLGFRDLEMLVVRKVYNLGPSLSLNNELV